MSSANSGNRKKKNYNKSRGAKNTNTTKNGTDEHKKDEKTPVKTTVDNQTTDKASNITENLDNEQTSTGNRNKSPKKQHLNGKNKVNNNQQQRNVVATASPCTMTRNNNQNTPKNIAPPKSVQSTPPPTRFCASNTGAIPKSANYYYQPRPTANLNVTLPMYHPQSARFHHLHEQPTQLSLINRSLQNLQISEAHDNGTQSRRELLLSGQPLQISHLLTQDGNSYQQQVLAENRPIPYSQILASSGPNNHAIPHSVGPNFVNQGYHQQTMYPQRSIMIPQHAVTSNNPPPYAIFPSNVQNYQTIEQINTPSPIVANIPRHYTFSQIKQLEDHQLSTKRNLYDAIAESFRPLDKENRSISLDMNQLSVSQNHPPLIKNDYNLPPLGNQYLERHEAIYQRILEQEELERRQNGGSTRYRIRTHLFHNNNDSLLPLRSISFDCIFNYFRSNDFNIYSELISRSCPPWFCSLASTPNKFDNQTVFNNEVATCVKTVTRIHNRDKQYRIKQLTGAPIQYARHLRPHLRNGKRGKKKQMNLENESEDEMNSDFDEFPFESSNSSDSEDSFRLAKDTSNRFYPSPIKEHANFSQAEMMQFPGYEWQPRIWSNYQNISRPPVYLYPYKLDQYYTRNVQHNFPRFFYQQSQKYEYQTDINQQPVRYIPETVQNFGLEEVPQDKTPTITTDNEFVDVIFGSRENSPRRQMSPKKYSKSPRKRLQSIDEIPQEPEAPIAFISPAQKPVNFSTSFNDFTSFMTHANDLGLSQSWPPPGEHKLPQKQKDTLVTTTNEDIGPWTVLPPWSISLPASTNSPLVCQTSCSITTSTSNVWKPMSTMEIKSMWQSLLPTCSTSEVQSKKQNEFNQFDNFQPTGSKKSKESVNYWKPLPDCQTSVDFRPLDYSIFNNCWDETIPRKRIETDSWQPLLTPEQEETYKKYLRDNQKMATEGNYSSDEEILMQKSKSNKTKLFAKNKKKSSAAGPSCSTRINTKTYYHVSSVNRRAAQSAIKTTKNRRPSIEDCTEFPIDTWDSDEKTKNDTDSDF
ncbi:uncharacterized protein LOC123290873 isoform X1 [Chrysoperla carnea]|uniref:uncharacterized protein LOC123290873 isoform X1 n=1 Tax=Chrysoperla carnea TaxID=189513 RepID=UPI001D0889DE|nr:uncharacterized protein LOC123290873 isoform X1 [Chrysoperla carnea]